MDLNPIRAALAQTLEESDYTSAQRRIESLQSPDKCTDRFLAPLTIDELRDWTARQPVACKRGVTPSDTPAILQRLGLEADVWCELSRDFDKLFSLVAGRPAEIDQARTRGRQARFHTRPRTRELMSA